MTDRMLSERPTGCVGMRTTKQAMTINEYYTTQDPTVIDTRLAMALREERLEADHLRIRQPEKIAH